MQALNLNMSVQGSGVVVSQDIVAGTEVEEGTVVNLTLKDEMVGGAFNINKNKPQLNLRFIFILHLYIFLA